MSEPFFFTWSSQNEADYVDLRSGRGVFFETPEGEFLDFGSMVWQANAGHGVTEIIDGLCEQANRLAITMPKAVFPEKRALAEKLLSLAPAGFTKVFFTLSGAEATENALKIARVFTKKSGVITRRRSYHGASMGALSATGDARRTPFEPLLEGFEHVPDLENDFVSTNIPEALARRTQQGTPVGAVMLETMVGANGVLIPEGDYYRQVELACRKHQALLILDEVLVGFGRTGKAFAFEYYPELRPDMVTLGKAITAGYGVLGAVLVHERVASYFDDATLNCGLTNYAHPLGIRAALEAQRYYQKYDLFSRARSLEAALLQGLARLPQATATRGRGLFAAVSLSLTDSQWIRLKSELKRALLHAHIKPQLGVIMVAPPLIITEDELNEGLRRMASAINAAC